jgi:hypothetical protein
MVSIFAWMFGLQIQINKEMPVQFLPCDFGMKGGLLAIQMAVAEEATKPFFYVSRLRRYGSEKAGSLKKNIGHTGVSMVI